MIFKKPLFYKGFALPQSVKIQKRGQKGYNFFEDDTIFSPWQAAGEVNFYKLTSFAWIYKLIYVIIYLPMHGIGRRVGVHQRAS